MSSTRKKRSTNVARWILVAAVLVALIVLMRLLPVARGVEALRQWVDGLGWAGMLVFGLAYTLAAILFVPGSALTLAAGAIFGLFWGTALVSVFSTLAAALAFLIARYFARSKVEGLARRHAKFRAVDAAIGKHGWRIIALLRLSPAMPFSASNYLYGLTAVRFAPYVLASWIAMLPGTFMYVYLGHIGGVAASAAGGESGARTTGEYVLLAVGILATIVVTVYITRIARRALSDQAELAQVPEAASTGGAP
jgi:uncharacterized membrane protein YdjX (TVP38/TMEM64 family)